MSVAFVKVQRRPAHPWNHFCVENCEELTTRLTAARARASLLAVVMLASELTYVAILDFVTGVIEPCISSRLRRSSKPPAAATFEAPARSCSLVPGESPTSRWMNTSFPGHPPLLSTPL